MGAPKPGGIWRTKDGKIKILCEDCVRGKDVERMSLGYRISSQCEKCGAPIVIE